MHIPRPSERYTPRFKGSLPSSIDEMLDNESYFTKLKATIRLYRRFLTLLISAQLGLEYEYIPRNIRRVLWINVSSTSIGDSIMELSGRVLLREKYQLDLLTDAKNAAIYASDDIFNRVYNSAEQIDENYDFVLLDINNSKSIRLKAKYFKCIPFASIMGYFYGADFNRMLFSFKRINALQGYAVNDEYINQHAQNYLNLANFRTLVSERQIVLVIGGEDQLIRTYHRWDSVVTLLSQQFSEYSIVLIGSANGVEMSAKIMSLKLPNLRNEVNQLSLVETASIIANSDYFIGADGGLMHIADALNIAGVALFARFKAKFRLAPHTLLRDVYANDKVSDIEPEIIVEVFTEVVTSQE